MVKRLFLALALALGPRWAFAGDIVISNFAAGLNTLDTPAELDPSSAQDLLNVQLQPGGGSVFKRDGYGLFQSLPVTCSTCAIHGGHHFQQVSGNDVQLWGNDGELSASVNDATFVRIATGTTGATWQCADSQGFAYCLNSSRDSPVKTDGTAANTSYQPSLPLGTMATFSPTQLIIAGVSGNENTIYVSQQNTFTTFTIGVLPSSAFIEPIASPGSRITHLAFYFGKLFWWKDQSFGYATFTNQNDWQLTIVSNQIGTLDNSDAFWNSSGFDSGAKFTGTASANAGQSPGGIFFRGQDNHFYVYDGFYLTRISRPITPTVTAASRKKSSGWTQTTTADFNAGSTSSTTVTNNAVFLSTNNANAVSNNSFESGATSPPARWTTEISSGSGLFQSAAPATSCGCSPGAFDGNFIGSFSGTTSASFLAALVDMSSNVLTSATLPTTFSSCAWSTYTFSSSGLIGTVARVRFEEKGTGGGVQDYRVYSSSFVITNDVSFRVVGLNFNSAGTCDGFTMYFDDITGGLNTVTSGSYYSAVNNAPNLTSWASFNAMENLTGGSISYFTRSSTNPFTVLSSTPAWVSQMKNTQVAASTGTYFQMGSTFTVTLGSQTAELDDFQFNWFEGSAADKSYMTYFNDAIWFSVSTSSSSSTNNRIFYWDLLNGAWTVYDIPANGFQIENNALYFGDPTQGRVFRYGGVTTDNGLAINSYWRSKSFYTPSVTNTATPPSFEDAFVQKQFTQADFILGESSTTLAYIYTIDSKTPTTVNITAYDSAASLIQRNFSLAPGKIGKYYDFRIGDNSSQQAWRMMGHRVKYEAQAWRPVTR